MTGKGCDVDERDTLERPFEESRPGVPRHAALSQGAARGSRWSAGTRADRRPRGSDRPRAGSAPSRLGGSRAARFTRPALVNGAVGVVLAPRGRLSRVLRFTFANGKIARIEVVGDPERFRELDLAVLE